MDPEQPRRRHYENRAKGGQCMFATTTVIDFAPVFREPGLAEAAMRTLLKQVQSTGARLHACVVMHHHVHIVVGLPADGTGPGWMQKLKSDIALLVRPSLTDAHREWMSQQVGLNGRGFWRRSFRSTVLVTPKVFWQKVRYTHLNPVRAGYCDREEDYPWSSKRFWEAGLWSEDAGLDVDRALAMLERSG
jgi:REP element-mobilizing transposase RayT